MTAKRIALYARVSTSKCEKCGKRQSDHEDLDHEYRGQDAEVQLRELREYIERRGWQIAEIYTDTVSGTKKSRPGLDKLMGDAARRRFDVVVVWRFDRFARSVSHLLRALEQFQALGIDFVSLSENVDTSTPTGKMIFTVLGAVAELERSLIVERVKAGLRNARQKGRNWDAHAPIFENPRLRRFALLGHPGEQLPKRQALGWERSTESLSGVPKTFSALFLSRVRGQI